MSRRWPGVVAVGYREVELVSLAPPDGYLAIFLGRDELAPVESIRPCQKSP